MDKELLEHLRYSKCDCPIDYREEIKVFNAVCPVHLKSTLLIDGVPIKIYLNVMKAKLNRVANTQK